MVGIMNLKALVIACAHISNAVDGATNHPTTVSEKLSIGMTLLPEFMRLPGISFKAIQDEISDLDDEEKADLNAAVKAEFNIADEKLEQVIEGSIALVMKLESLVKEAVALAQVMKS